MDNNMDLNYEMFCYQCEQTAGGKGCTKLGVCGKTPEIAALQDLLIFQLKGISCYAKALADYGQRSHNGQDTCKGRGCASRGDNGQSHINKAIVSFIESALFTTLTNVNFDADAHIELLHRSQQIKEALRSEAKASDDSEAICKAAEKTAHATFDLPESKSEMLQESQIAGIMYERDLDPDIRSLRQTIVYGLKGISAYGHQARELGFYSDQVDDFYITALEATTDDSLRRGRTDPDDDAHRRSCF